MSSTLAARVKSARERLGLSRRALSERAKLGSDAHVGMIERGAREQVAGETVAKLAAALGCDLAWLMTGEGEPYEADTDPAPASVSGPGAEPPKAEAG